MDAGGDPLNEGSESIALIGFETLRAVKTACDWAGCTREEAEDVRSLRTQLELDSLSSL